MSFTYAEMHQKKEGLFEQLGAALENQFNQHSYSIAYGIKGSKGRGYDFTVNLTDLCHPGQKVDNKVVSFVTQKVQELVPGSRPEVQGIQPPRVR
jgi:hypothetical protein